MSNGATGGVVDFDDALSTVLRHAGKAPRPSIESAPLPRTLGRVLAEAVYADRDQPPFHRSTRDGFAVRAADLKTEATLQVTGLLRAGEQSQHPLQPGDTVEIMTGAPLPDGADAVLMVEHVEREGDAIRVLDGRRLYSGENVVLRGSEAQAGKEILAAGTPVEPAQIALAASCGYAAVSVFCRPRVAIIATGDELVELDRMPEPQQIRNSNSYSLAALVEQAEGEAVPLGIAADRRDAVEEKIRAARSCDLILLSGGVSMGKYDLVEEVLQSLGAEFFFTGVRMQPGKPIVFGRLPATGHLPSLFFFGLPGNPISTQVTFHCFVQPMLRALAGAGAFPPRFVQATLAGDVKGKPDLMRILPARLTSTRVRAEVTIVPWHGSGDLTANAQANCYAVLPPEKELFTTGEVISVLLP